MDSVSQTTDLETDMQSTILEAMKTDGSRNFGLHNPIAIKATDFTFSGNTPFPAILGYFNNFAHHSPALALSIADNLLIKLMTNKSISITVSCRRFLNIRSRFLDN
jgi:hypothetical protein